MQKFYLALDQGTTSSRALVFSESGRVVASASRALPCSYPQSGWVEQDPREIWRTQHEALLEAAAAVPSEKIKAIGITNQRETTVAWDRRTGEPLAPAVVWQCRRSAEICERWRGQGLVESVAERTGLVIDSYFSAGKILWLLEEYSELKARAAAGDAVFGTVDAWLIYNLTGELCTEPSNASRTMLFNTRTGQWDDELLRLVGISTANLPEVRPSAGTFGVTKVLGNPIPVTGALGDQQASLLGHGCVRRGESKCTFGTGAFLLVNTAEQPVRSAHGLLSSVGWTVPEKSDFAATYVLEGSIFIAGALIQWLRDGLRVITSAEASELAALSVSDSAGAVIVPAFVGLGAPYWDEQVRGAVFGLTREIRAEHLVRAAFEAVADQVADLLEDPALSEIRTLSIDGGMSANKAFCQILADRTGINVSAAASPELSALGAARIALVGAGGAGSPMKAAEQLAADAQGARMYHPLLDATDRERERARWKAAVQAARSFRAS